MEGRCAGADEVVMREAVLSDVRQVGHIVHQCAGERGARTAAQKYRGVVSGERGDGKRGYGRVLDGGQSEGGGGCAARMLRKSGALKTLRAQDHRRDKCLGL